MIRKIKVNDSIIEYDLQFKKVKNINLRFKSDGSINVSANKRVSQSFIDEFITSKQDFILKALEKTKEISDKPKHQYCTELEIKELITNLCEKVYPYYEAKGIKYPKVKFRKMVSRWGSCNPQKGILPVNTNLMFSPFECVEYVVYHEFTHFLQANHSKRFYEELEKVYSTWKESRKKLREIYIR